MNARGDIVYIEHELPGWSAEWDDERSVLRVETAELPRIVIEGSTAADVVSMARTLARLTESARVLFGGADAAVLALSDEVWPTTRRLLGDCAPCRAGVPPRSAPQQARGCVVRSQGVNGRKVSTPASHGEAGPPAVPISNGGSVHVARAKGYTGIPCDNCGSPNTVRQGTCLRCDDCHHAGGCG